MEICSGICYSGILTYQADKRQFFFVSSSSRFLQPSQTSLIQASVLALPNFSLLFQIQTDAFGLGIGAVMLQQGHPIAYFSKKLSSHLIRASTYVRELFAVTQVVFKWSQYLLGHHFSILTDHHSFKEIVNQVIHTPEQQKYLVKLLGYDFDITYHLGKSNVVAALYLEDLSLNLLLFHPRASYWFLPFSLSSLLTSLRLKLLRTRITIIFFWTDHFAP